jgi:hypothetical protein
VCRARAGTLRPLRAANNQSGFDSEEVNEKVQELVKAAQVR